MAEQTNSIQQVSRPFDTIYAVVDVFVGMNPSIKKNDFCFSKQFQQIAVSIMSDRINNWTDLPNLSARCILVRGEESAQFFAIYFLQQKL